jgi:ATP-dependent Clp protease ATP-binding subunit ClpC
MISKHLSKEAECIVNLAKEFARLSGQNYVGTEHLLLGILGEGEGLGAKVLTELGVDQEQAKAKVDELIADRLQETWVLGRLPGTPHFRDVLARASEHSKGAGNWQVKSEHLLLALLMEKNSTGFKALHALGATLEAVRQVLARYKPTT